MATIPTNIKVTGGTSPFEPVPVCITGADGGTLLGELTKSTGGAAADTAVNALIDALADAGLATVKAAGGDS